MPIAAPLTRKQRRSRSMGWDCSIDCRKDVDELVRKAVAAGGKTYNQAQDRGFMYAHGYQDLDGHIWELIYMEPGAVN
jgi:uncharacterized protein